jgi:hypothetical protein
VVFDWRARVRTPFRSSTDASRSARPGLSAVSRDDAELLRTMAANRWPLDVVVQTSSTA